MHLHKLMDYAGKAGFFIIYDWYDGTSRLTSLRKIPRRCAFKPNKIANRPTLKFELYTLRSFQSLRVKFYQFYRTELATLRNPESPQLLIVTPNPGLILSPSIRILDQGDIPRLRRKLGQVLIGPTPGNSGS
ncbi:hypothetical protein WA026_013947 [Henosepilachna vigintioctopunctata]|uniref:Uncharacterized protein n=1 Tax=Henosepilachna vigintioctopunctata TaxID=420089 RepID=A0AAW1U6C8_9CUCU